MGIRVIHGGVLTTVQDMGRVGYQKTGMPVSGVMDPRSAALANLLVGNPPEEGVLEATVMGPELEFLEDNILAVTGADLGAQLEGQPFPLYQAVRVRAGQRLRFSGPRAGSRAYLAFAGGLGVPAVMGSKATNLKSGIGGFQGRKLEAGDEIPFPAPRTELPHMAERKLEAEDFSPCTHTLRVILGPQDHRFTQQGIQTFLEREYTVSPEYDRMGCRMQGPVIQQKNGGDMITDGICFGSVQVPSHGNPIVMMADHQTTGGYAKIATVITVDLPVLAQSMPGHKIRFQPVSVEEAQDWLCTWKNKLESLDRQWNAGSESRERKEKAAPEPRERKENIVLKPSSSGAGSRFTYRVTVNGEEYLVEVEKIGG